MSKISRKKMAKILRNERGSTFVRFSALTPAGKGQKQVDAIGLLNTNYGGPRKWGEVVGSEISYEGKQYLRVRRGRVLREVYLLNGQEVTKEELGIKPRKSGDMGLRNYNLENVQSLQLRGTEYTLEN